MKKIIRIFNLIKAELFAKHCSVCGRRLTSEESRRLGKGHSCAQKTGIQQELEKEGQLRLPFEE